MHGSLFADDSNLQIPRYTTKPFITKYEHTYTFKVTSTLSYNNNKTIDMFPRIAVYVYQEAFKTCRHIFSLICLFTITWLYIFNERFDLRLIWMNYLWKETYRLNVHRNESCFKSIYLNLRPYTSSHEEHNGTLSLCLLFVLIVSRVLHSSKYKQKVRAACTWSGCSNTPNLALI